MKRYSIETPPYARGRLVENEDGAILKLEEVREIMTDAIYALQRARNYPNANRYQLAEIDAAIMAIRDVVGHPEPEAIREAV